MCALRLLAITIKKLPLQLDGFKVIFPTWLRTRFSSLFIGICSFHFSSSSNEDYFYYPRFNLAERKSCLSYKVISNMNSLNRSFTFPFLFYCRPDFRLLVFKENRKKEHEVIHTWFCNKWNWRTDRSIAVRIFGLNSKIIPEIRRKHSLKENLVWFLYNETNNQTTEHLLCGRVRVLSFHKCIHHRYFFLLFLNFLIFE